jgi:hypothetical protein
MIILIPEYVRIGGLAKHEKNHPIPFFVDWSAMDFSPGLNQKNPGFSTVNFDKGRQTLDSFHVAGNTALFRHEFWRSSAQ